MKVEDLTGWTKRQILEKDGGLAMKRGRIQHVLILFLSVCSVYSFRSLAQGPSQIIQRGQDFAV